MPSFTNQSYNFHEERLIGSIQGEPYNIIEVEKVQAHRCMLNNAGLENNIE